MKNTFSLIFLLLLTSCGGGGGGSTATTGSAGTASGIFSGTTTSGYNVAYAVLSDTTTWGFYYFGNTIYGAFKGNASGVGNAFTMTGTALNFATQTVASNSFTGSVVAGVSMTGNDSLGLSFTSSYSAMNNSTVNLSAIAGSYTGNSVSKTGGNQRVTLNLSATGAITGTNNGCTTNGTATPTSQNSIFNLSITLSGTCLMSGTTAAGVVVVDITNTTPYIYAIGLNTAGSDGFLFSGSQSTAAGTSVSTFNLQSAYQSYIQAIPALKMNISGGCTGTYVATTTAPTADTFRGTAGHSTITSSTRNLSNCTPASTVSTTTDYFNNSYAPLGSISPGTPGIYAYFSAVPTLPTNATVGSSGTIGTELLFTDSGFTTGAGSIVVTYALTADTLSTAIVSVTGKFYNVSNVLQTTIVDRYQLSTTGALKIISTNVTYHTSGLNLIYQ